MSNFRVLPVLSLTYDITRPNRRFSKGENANILVRLQTTSQNSNFQFKGRAFFETKSALTN